MESREEIEATFDRLWPLHRSLTGDGVRRTHDILGELVPLTRFEIPTGTRVLDWVVPPEWVVRDAYVIDPSGERIIDVADNNLHLMGYATPFRGRISKDELAQHLYSLPSQPDAIPYITSYYKPEWGFCITDNQRKALPDGDYEVVIDTEHVDGSLTISESYLPGDEPREVLLSTYTCHPSMANNELSGPLVAAYLWRRLSAWPARRLSYRLAFLPETIGSIAYLAMRGEEFLQTLEAGYVITCAGDAGPFTLKRSRRGSTVADRAAELVLSDREGAKILDFFPHRGSDERQYCSPGFNLPVASIMRTMYGEYPEYHTSLDDRKFISFDALQETVSVYEEVLRTIDTNATYRNLAPRGEPQLGRRGLYPSIGSSRSEVDTDAILWVLNCSDGDHDLIDIAVQSGMRFSLLLGAANSLTAAGLLERLP